MIQTNRLTVLKELMESITMDYVRKKVYYIFLFDVTGVGSRDMLVSVTRITIQAFKPMYLFHLYTCICFFSIPLINQFCRKRYFLFGMHIFEVP